MTRIGLALLAAVGTVLFAGAAQAKAPPGGVDVCGPSACAHLGMADAEQLWIGQTSISSSRAVPGPYYLLRWSWSPGEEDTAYLVLGSAAVRFNGGPGNSAGWAGVDSRTVDTVRRVAAGVDPYPTPTLTRAKVGVREAAEPQTYLRLFAGKPDGKFVGGRWWRVRLESSVPSPWTTDGSPLIRLSSSHPYVSIDGMLFRLPGPIVRQARFGLALTG
jgi:hypothetical protein